MKSKISHKQLLEDLEWAYNRLDHMFFVHNYPNTPQGHFGMGESMKWLKEHLPDLRKRYGFKSTWPEPTDIKKARSNPVVEDIVRQVEKIERENKMLKAAKPTLDQLYKAYKGICQITLKPIRKKDAVIEHLMPKCKGGRDDWTNITLVSEEGARILNATPFPVLGAMSGKTNIPVPKFGKFKRTISSG